MKRPKFHISFIISWSFGFLLLLFSIFYQDLSRLSGIKDWLRILSNAALVPGVLLTGISVLVKISEEGIFDGAKYAVSSIFSHLRKNPKPYASYYEYMRREKKKGNITSFLFSGLFYLILAICFTLFYYY